MKIRFSILALLLAATPFCGCKKETPEDVQILNHTIYPPDTVHHLIDTLLSNILNECSGSYLCTDHSRGGFLGGNGHDTIYINDTITLVKRNDTLVLAPYNEFVLQSSTDSSYTFAWCGLHYLDDATILKFFHYGDSIYLDIQTGSPGSHFEDEYKGHQLHQ